MTHWHYSLEAASIDRIDSNLGYLKGNIQIVQRWINLAKGDTAQDEFDGVLRNYEQRIKFETLVKLRELGLLDATLFDSAVSSLA